MPSIQIELPAELVTVLSLFLVGVVTTLVTDGCKSLAEALSKIFKRPVNLSKFQTIITAAASAFVVSVVIGLINLSLSFVPPEFYQIVQAVFVVLIGMFGAMGLHRRAKLSRPDPAISAYVD
ncbi:MAG TPA: hypothetical protein VFM05_03530 [Candidatus Saccharimonadales bacterium]|nr:hypothetical protein [Candidatus Saccharimonadales bacterium]